MEWSCNVLRFGIGYFGHCATIFDTVRLFPEKIFELLSRAPTQIISTARANYDTCGYLYHLQLLFRFNSIGKDTLVMF